MSIPFLFARLLKLSLVVKTSLYTVLFLFYLSSCTVSKHSYLFRAITKDTIINNLPDSFKELKIKKNDVLSINISSLNKEEDVVFNGVIPIGTNKDINAGGAGYLVSEDGNIYLHKLGKIKAVGLTRNQLKNQIEKDLQPFLKDAIVTVSFSNHFVTVIGEIEKSQRILMPEEKISLIDILALSGSFTPNARISDLLLIRDTANAKIFKKINLENSSIFTSPMYYLQPDDIVVINPDERKIILEQRKSKYQTYVATSLQLVSILLIIYQVFVRK